MMALALVNQLAHSRFEVVLQFVSPLAKPEPATPESPRAYFERMRKDPDWGFAPSRWN